MLFWIMCAALLALVGGSILLPLLRQGRDGDTAQPAAAYDLQVYRDQLREVERDLDRKVISPDDADRLRTEIGRKVLDADRRLAQSGAPGRNGAIAVAAAVLAVIFAGSVWLYGHEGAPGMPDLPLQARLDAAQRIYDNRPSQAEAVQNAPPVTPITPDPETAELLDRLRAVVAQRPDDPQGLALLARHEAGLGRVDAAMAAQRQLIQVLGDRATADDHAHLASLMVEAAGGLITPESEAVIARALAMNPHQPQALYMAGLLQAQNGRPDRTFAIWSRLLEESPPDAPWVPPIAATIGDLAWLAGQPNYQPPMPSAGMPALPGPDADMIAGAQDMTPEDRQQMITGMVEQLESRLATQGGTPEEWARLISSLVVIGRAEHAADIWAEAQTRFTDRPQARDMIDQAARDAGLTK